MSNQYRSKEKKMKKTWRRRIQRRRETGEAQVLFMQALQVGQTPSQQVDGESSDKARETDHKTEDQSR